MTVTDHLKEVEERLGYNFGDKSILRLALTHTSYGHEKLLDRPIAQQNNERLEFLGDAVLDVVITDLLLEYFPAAPEGRLSKMRAAVVNEKTLAEMAKTLRLGTYVQLGKGEARAGGSQKASILSSTFEALIAAIYLDGGFHAVYPVVRHLFAAFFKGDEQWWYQSFDYKTQLQEIAQAKWRSAPSYHLTKSEGPDHAKIFEIEVRMKGQVLAKSTGSSKKDAEQSAARLAIQNLVQ